MLSPCPVAEAVAVGSPDMSGKGDLTINISCSGIPHLQGVTVFLDHETPLKFETNHKIALRIVFFYMSSISPKNYVALFTLVHPRKIHEAALGGSVSHSCHLSVPNLPFHRSQDFQL